MCAVPAVGTDVWQDSVERLDEVAGKLEEQGQPRPVLRKLDKVLLGVISTGMVIFMVMGSLSSAPYWLFDGAAFLVTLLLSWLAFASKSCVRQRLALGLIWRLAVVYVCIEVSFLVAAIVLFRKVMNPWAPEGHGAYGRDGSSFVFCSFFSALINSCVVYRFKTFG
jgi:hypothetical protein